MEVKSIFTLLGVVCITAPCSGNSGSNDVGPIVEGLKTGIATPEVVVQLKYEQGELNRIYLTQFRKDGTLRDDSVPASPELCADLCHAGLGGESCGATCTDMIPVGLASALRSENKSRSHYGEPRVQVCPTLCANRLGAPLCSCPPDLEHAKLDVDWDAVCSVFCLNDGYVLGGCPACKEIQRPVVPAKLANSRLNTAEGWISWCNTQCRQGHGGAACNCDRGPFH